MSDGVLHIKQELEGGLHVKNELFTAVTAAVAAATNSSVASSCCSPTGNMRVDRSNSYSNGTNTSTTSTSTGTGVTGNASTSNPSNGHKSSPSVSPERQQCSSTTILNGDLQHCNSFKDEKSLNNISGTSNSTNNSIRDELRRLCLVCGDIASGFHYGVASCEACKAFFKRTIQGNIEYSCPANNECEINKRRRKACQACRFQKCLLMGMLKEGVRLDRVRGGRQKYRRNPASNSYQNMQLLYQSNTGSLDDVKILEALSSYEPDAISVQQCITASDDSQQSTASGNLKHEHASSTTSNSNSAAVTPTPPAAMPCIFQNNNLEPNDVLSILCDLYDKELVSVIGWAKQIPGFTELAISDQMKLLQVSWAEILTLQLAFRSLPFTGKLCFALDVRMDELLAKECGCVEFFHHCVLIAQRLERLSPRREEYYLMKALLLSNCDILLDDQSALRAFRESILNALNDVVYLLRHSAAVSHQQQLLMLLPSLRQADFILRRFWRKVHRDGTIPLRKLFAEMLDPVTR